MTGGMFSALNSVSTESASAIPMTPVPEPDAEKNSSVVSSFWSCSASSCDSEKSGEETSALASGSIPARTRASARNTSNSRNCTCNCSMYAEISSPVICDMPMPEANSSEPDIDGRSMLQRWN